MLEPSERFRFLRRMGRFVLTGAAGFLLGMAGGVGIFCAFVIMVPGWHAEPWTLDVVFFSGLLVSTGGGSLLVGSRAWSFCARWACAAPWIVFALNLCWLCVREGANPVLGPKRMLSIGTLGMNIAVAFYLGDVGESRRRRTDHAKAGE